MIRGLTLLIGVVFLAGCLQAPGPGDDGGDVKADPEAVTGSKGGSVSSDGPPPGDSGGQGPVGWPLAHEHVNDWGDQEWVFHAVDRVREGGCPMEGDSLEEVDHSAAQAGRLLRLHGPGCFVEGELGIEAPEAWVTVRLLFLGNEGDAREGSVEVFLDDRSVVRVGGSGGPGSSAGGVFTASLSSTTTLRLTASDENEGALYLDAVQVEQWGEPEWT